MAAPQQAEISMVVGDRRVPLRCGRLPNSEGTYKCHWLVDLNVRFADEDDGETKRGTFGDDNSGSYD